MSPDRGTTTVNLQTTDAMFAVLITKMDQAMVEIRGVRSLVERNEARVAALEQSNVEMKSRLVGAMFVISAVVGVVSWLLQNEVPAWFRS